MQTSRQAGQVDSETRNTIGTNEAHGVIEEAASDPSRAYAAAKEAQGIAGVTM